MKSDQQKDSIVLIGAHSAVGVEVHKTLLELPAMKNMLPWEEGRFGGYH